MSMKFEDLDNMPTDELIMIYEGLLEQKWQEYLEYEKMKIK